MVEEKLPFNDFNKPLKSILEKQYLLPITKWLLGSDNESYILAQNTNSLWESALTIIYLEKLKTSITLTKKLENTIDNKIPIVVDWLIEKKSIYTKNHIEYINWENVTWDTSVVIRAILTSIKTNQSHFSYQRKKEIEDIAFKALIWLYSKFSDWDNNVKYPFGAADLAQIVTTSIFIHNEFPELSNRITTYVSTDTNLVKHFKDCKNILDASQKIIEYLLFIKEKRSVESDLDKDLSEIYWWDDYFTTAETIDCLSAFYTTCNQNNLKKYYKVLTEISYTIMGACLYFEENQYDGMWGSHIDTIKVLDAYINISSLKKLSSDKKLIEPEIHTAFKAIRWICDEKQIFSDGSFMHTMFLSIFYANVLMTVHNTWEHADKKVYELYDDVVWSAPIRTTPERNIRLSTEMENNKLEEKLLDNEKKLKDAYGIILFFILLFLWVVGTDFIYDYIDIKSNNFPKAVFTMSVSLFYLVIKYWKKYML
ncbi:MAG TPA: hypothetical protein EYG73_11065 [Arcobacter sp.]|nr:hypothetical protein [Arcobacter sp.]